MGAAVVAEAQDWAARAPVVPAGWFTAPHGIHGVRHTQRVCLHAVRLAHELGWDEPDIRLALLAALWHDIGRTSDGRDPWHGRESVRRVKAWRLAGELTPASREIVFFAIRYHAMRDETGESAASELADPACALRLLWLLKDADGLDRVRLGPRGLDPAQFRSPQAAASVDFARALLEALP